MVLKDAFFYAAILDRSSTAFLVLSFVYVALTVQSMRMAANKNKPGTFPITWLVCLTLCFEAFSRSGVLFSSSSLGVTKVFDGFKPVIELSKKTKLPVGDIFFFVLRVLGGEENGNGFLVRVLLITFALYVSLTRLSHGSGSAASPRRGWFKILSIVTLGLFAATTMLIGRSCGESFVKRPVTLAWSQEMVVKISENFHQCAHGPFGLGDALVTVAMLHASLAWTQPSWIGMQHVLAFRWAGAVAHALSLHLNNQLINSLVNPTDIVAQTEAFAVLLQVLSVFFLFVPRFAYMNPMSFFILLNLLAPLIALTLGYVALPVEALHRLASSIGLGVAFLSFLAVFFAGGIAIAFAMFTVFFSASVHAPWLRAMVAE